MEELTRRLHGVVTWTRRHPFAPSAFGFAVLFVAFFEPALIGGKVLTPAPLLYLIPPWSAERPANLASFLNPLLSDVPTQFYPWMVFARDAVHHGVLPLWNSLIGTGTPFFANDQAAVLSPFTILAYVFHLPWALGLIAFVKLWVAAMGSYMFARELGARPLPSCLAGVSFAFCSFNVVWLSHPHTNVSVLLPAVLWLTERVLQRGRLADVPWLALAVGVAFLGGHPGTQVHLGYALVIYCACRLPISRLTLREAASRLALVAAGVVCGIAMAGVVVLPAAREVSQGSSVSGRVGGGVTLPYTSLRTVLFPYWWGSPAGANFGGPINFNERTLYAGAVAFPLAVAALLSPRRCRTVLPLVAVGLIGLAVALGVPVIHSIAVKLPGLGSVQDARMLLLFELAVCVCAAIGLDELLDRRSRTTSLWLALAATVVIGIALTIPLHPSVADIRSAIGDVWHARPPVSPLLASLGSVVWWGFLVIVLAAVAAGLLRKPSLRWLAGAAIVALAVVDGVHFADGYQPIAPAAKALPAATPLVRYLQRHRAAGRFVGIGSAMLNNDYPMVYGLSDVRSYDTPYPDKPYFALWSALINPGQSDAYPLFVPALTPLSRTALSILGVRYIADPPGGAIPALPQLREVYHGPDGAVYENLDAAPRVMVPGLVSSAPTEAAFLAAVSSGHINPTDSGVVEGSPRAARAGRGTAYITASSNASVSIRSDLTVPGLVLLNDLLAPGWTVTIDGHAARPLRVNAVMRGVDVPAGVHTIRWHYDPPGLTLGIVLSLLGLVTTAGLAITARALATPPPPVPARPD